MDYFLLLCGLVALFVGGEGLVRGAVGIARHFAVPPLLIGLTVVGFGTSTPELLVSADAALRGVPDIALGNVIGSNIANILLIVGLATLVSPILVPGGSLRRDAGVMVAAAVILLPIFAIGHIGRVSGSALVILLIGYLVWAYRSASAVEPDLDQPSKPLWRSLMWSLGGLVAMLFGARWLVDSSVSIARDFGVSEAFIGLTIVAVGTSLPELATSLVAAMRRQSDIAIGNVVGSNIFNVLGILGATALIAPVQVSQRFLWQDLPVMIGLSIVFAALLLGRPVLGRGVGALMLLAYAVYIVFALS